jgi:protein O-GlcNAc transferase
MASSSPRNAPCPCGSGKRYKDCHGALSSGPPVESAAEELLRKAGAAFGGGDRVAARMLLDRALALDATNPEANFQLANSLRQRGEISAAIERYRLALLRAPAHPGVLNNLGLALEASGERDGAETCYRDALAADPQHADALGNLGRLLLDRERLAESAAVYDRLATVRRQLPPAIWVGRAIAQRGIGDLASAEASFREAARLAPNDCAIQLNIGTVCSEQYRHEEAERAWLRALELDPLNLYALSMLAQGRQQRCDWRGLDVTFAELNRLLEAEDPDDSARSHANPFPMLSMPTSPRARLHAARLWAGGFAMPGAVQAPAVAPGERRRVGFVSSDFGEHPISFLWMECWERLDRRRIETFAYGIRPPDRGPIGSRIAKSFAHFADVSAEGTAEIVRRIRADRIAILVDLNGYTRHSREKIFALRPAPVQINCIGFPGTLGAAWYDYIFTDRFSLPQRLAPFYSERALYMPHMAFPSDTTRLPAGPPPTRAACGLPEQGFVFCCFNNAYKILPGMFAIWMRLLQAVPGSVLWLLEANPEARANLRREAAQAGVDPERLIFAPRAPVHEHVARNAAADLFVDTYPYGAHTTANDALLAGLPVLTCVGETLASRIAGSQLHAIGLPELVTESFTDYEALALELATQPTLLKSYRHRLAANRHTHPLFDMPAYARDFEDAMERVWRDYAGSAPV